MSGPPSYADASASPVSDRTPRKETAMATAEVRNFSAPNEVPRGTGTAKEKGECS